jgi:hypothetical protein
VANAVFNHLWQPGFNLKQIMKKTTIALTLGLTITLLACSPKTEPQVSAPPETAPQVTAPQNQAPQKEIDSPASPEKKSVAVEEKQPSKAQAEPAALEKQAPVADAAKSPTPNAVEQYLKPTMDDARAKTQTQNSRVRSRAEEAEAEMDALTKNK